jgi:uncharacterized membrane protein YjgN (DUF898 family)
VRELGFNIGNARLAGDAFSFHGRGGELFRGFLLAWLFFVLPLIALNIALSLSPANAPVLLLLYAFLLVFIPVALVGSARYRLSRTSWRGIRFGFDGTAMEFALGFVPRLLLTFLSLGLAYPVFACWRRSFMVNHARFGTQRLSITTDAGDLYGRFIVAWLLFVPTLGLSGAWFYGEMQAYFWNRTRIGPASFHCSMTGWDWLAMQIKNGIVTMITFGLYTPWALVGVQRLMIESLCVEDTVDLAAIRQQLDEASALGEGAAGLLDVDTGVGIG